MLHLWVKSCHSLLLRLCTFIPVWKSYLQASLFVKALLILAINLLLSSPLIQHMTVAKMSVYKRMKLACCFDCGRSERDCSCMSGSVHSNMDSLQRAFPLSSVSVHDFSTSLRACKFDRQPHAVRCPWPVSVCVCVSVSLWCVSCAVSFLHYFRNCGLLVAVLVVLVNIIFICLVNWW